MNISYIFDEAEKSLRNQWLLVSLLKVIAWPIILLGAFVLSFPTIAIFDFIPTLFMVGFSCLSFFALYHFTFRRPGIRYLKFVMAMTVLYLSKDLFFELKATNGMGILQALPFITLGISIWWFLLSLKIIKLNKKIKAHAPLTSVEKITI